MDTKCRHCGGELSRYYDSRYRGERGMCRSCGTNFPLE